MATTYTGTATYTTSVVIPDDGDLATAASVDMPIKSEIDMDFFLLQSYQLIPDSTSCISAWCTSGTTISISPIPLAIVSVNGFYTQLTTNIVSTCGVGEIEGGGGAYSANTWYYVYLYGDVVGNALFQSSTIPPDPKKLFKLGNDNYKYICSFRTDGTATPFPFYMNRGIYTYYSQKYVISGSSTSEAVIDLSTLVPTSSTCCELFIGLTNADLVPNTTSIRSYSNVGNDYIVKSGDSMYFSLKAPTDNTQKIRYQSTSTSNYLAVNVLGYYE